MPPIPFRDPAAVVGAHRIRRILSGLVGDEYNAGRSGGPKVCDRTLFV